MTTSQARKMHHACTDIYLMPETAILNPIGPAQLKLAKKIPRQVLVCSSSQNMFKHEGSVA